jgi:hypothetical protein
MDLTRNIFFYDRETTFDVVFAKSCQWGLFWPNLTTYFCKIYFIIIQNLQMEITVGVFGSDTVIIHGFERINKYGTPSQHFMEPVGSIPNSQELSTCSYP